MLDNPFLELMNDIVALVKQDGTRVEGIQASVHGEKITVVDGSLPIEDGDTIERERPGVPVERYMVLDAGFENSFYDIPARFHMKVRKETAIPRATSEPTHTYNFHGPNSRVNHNSLDVSVNIASTTSSQVFADLRSALQRVENANQRAELMARADAMESAQGSPGFLAQYQAFIAAVADHVTIVAPLLPALAQLLG